jgi:hypothetical protein
LEGVPTTNESYGYNANDHSHKPASHFIRLLAKSAARGGNQLMNIGPMGNGKIDEADVTILKGIGAWWKVNGESIRGTTRTPLAVQAWGESTRKGNRIYLHVFDWPADGKLVVGGLKTDVKTCHLLSSQEKQLPVSRTGLDLTITVPQSAPDSADSVVVLKCAGEPVADATRLLSKRVPVDTLRAYDGTRKGRLFYGPGKKTDDVVLNWTSKESAVVWPLRLNETATFEVGINYDAPAAIKQAKLTDGDAGKEAVKARKGAAGTYAVTVNGQEFIKPVRQGSAVKETLGTVILEPGNHEIRVSAKDITGEELFRLRNVTLKPAGP